MCDSCAAQAGRTALAAWIVEVCIARKARVRFARILVAFGVFFLSPEQFPFISLSLLIWRISIKKNLKLSQTISNYLKLFKLSYYLCKNPLKSLETSWIVLNTVKFWYNPEISVLKSLRYLKTLLWIISETNSTPKMIKVCISLADSRSYSSHIPIKPISTPFSSPKCLFLLTV